MRVEITGHGIFGATGEIPIGTIVEVKNEPLGWKGRYRIVGRTESKTAVTNEPPAVVTSAEALALSGGQFMTFKSAAKKALGDGAPDKKDELIDALVEKLSDTELKSFLDSKGVEVKDETREELVALAKAA